MVTVEVAVALPVAVAGLYLVAVGQMQAQLTDAARATARELARGTPAGEALRRGHDVEPKAELRVRSASREVEVSAERTLTGPGPVLGRLERTLIVTVHTTREEP